MIAYSDGREAVSMSPEVAASMDRLRDFMFEKVYLSSDVRRREEKERGAAILTFLYRYYEANPGKLPGEWQNLCSRQSPAETARDFVASMTDRYAIRTYNRLTRK